jgi:imidazolonepropionase-like amidohydrolase
MRMVGHVPSSVTAWEAIEARQRSLEHLMGVMQAVSTDAEALQFFEACAARGVRIAPTLTMWRRTSRDYERVARLTGLSARTKVEVLAGTDTGDPGTVPGETLHDELEELVKAGFAPHQALRAATIAPAKFLEWESGAVEKGMAADLLLLNANPLEDVRNTRKIAAVFVRGRYLSKARLAQR